MIRQLLFILLLIMSIAAMSSCATRHPHTTAAAKKVVYVPPVNKKYADNSTLAKKVRATLVADKDLQALPIAVNTTNNVVELYGFVATEDQKRKAVELAQRVHGVGAVMDALMVNQEEISTTTIETL